MTIAEKLQPLGRALMLPIAVLPAAGLLLRLGQPDLLDIGFVAAAGDAIFSNLGLLFAIGVAVGLARENHGAAGLAGAVGFLVATKGAQVLIAVPPSALTGIPNTLQPMAIDAFKAAAIAKLSVPAGIVSGLIAGWLYNRYRDIKLYEFLAFFGGRRFIPIASGAAGVVLAAIIGFGYATINGGMDALSHAVLGAGSIGLFAYGVLNRLLIVTGLHHIINNLAWFILGDFHGVTGDLKRFFAGDPNAGKFMSGFFPIMMFGLPAACLAMYQAALPSRRKEVAGLFVSMALTAFLTGVTEPIEFSFMFLAPALYAIHAVLTGAAMVIMDQLGIRLGFGFSAGLFDYLINFGKATRPLWLVPVGVAYFALYYALFSFAIRRFNLKTPGREDEPTAGMATAPLSNARGEAFVLALGGRANLISVDACTTRLRLILVDGATVDEKSLRTLGARGLVRPSANALQVVLGPMADQIAGEIREASSTAPVAPAEVAPQSPTVKVLRAMSPAVIDSHALLLALGGSANVIAVDTCSSRLRIHIVSGDQIDNGKLKALGVRGIARPKADSLHLVIGPGTEDVAEKLKLELA
ncbi:MAG: PTS transporter subunit EIIC [Proteobacteria bacterium]|nr:PTS transporter subunit EIIC [Pseudomonadota bacterium]